jgi:competence protein ComEC
MCFFALAFSAGILLLQQFSYLPQKQWISYLVSIFVVTWILFLVSKINLDFFRNQLYRNLLIAIMGVSLGFAWCLSFVYAQKSWSLPPTFEGKTLEATGYIASIPVQSSELVSFLFSVKKIKLNEETYSHSGLVHLSWYKKDLSNLHVGDRWRLNIRLKKIHSTQNPGGFDFEAWALQEGLRAKGYVIPKGNNILLESNPFKYLLYRIREKIKNKIEHHLPKSSTSPWITALVVGERHNIDQENWEILRNTGTNHLMAIAGLHIGFMSGLVYFIISFFWRLSLRLPLYLPAQHVAAVGSLVMALLYSALAGFSLPTQRACIMLCAFLLTGLSRRKTFTWQAWSLALIFVLLINPLVVLTESFWLSFGAVAFIIYGVSGRLAPEGIWWKWGRLQWVISLGLIPFSLWLFQQCSVVSFLANAIAIPWVACLIVPFSLLGSATLFLSNKLGALLLISADKMLAWLWVILAWFSHIEGSSWYHDIPSVWVLLAALLCVILLLIPAGFPGRWFGLVGLVALVNIQPDKPKSGEIWLTLLDVGQGLSTVIQTKEHVLVFDAGAKLSPNYDMGESIVIPFLRTQNITKVDRVVVSHGDNDHIGGVPAILKRLSVSDVKTSVPDKLAFHNVSYCMSGEAWEWDQVKFNFLYPTVDNLNKNNDSSCVLKISTGKYSILLTGDIEKYAEKMLVANQAENLSSTILIAPHHGSKTSAENSFLNLVSPQFVLFPIGYRNRYHFPHASVIKKYDELGSEKIDTVSAGAVYFKLTPDSLKYYNYRDRHRRYWYAMD